MNRFVGIAATSLWLIAMFLLVRRDVLPFWTAQEAPVQALPDETFQVAIRTRGGARGDRLGLSGPDTDDHHRPQYDLSRLPQPGSFLSMQGPVIFDMNMAYEAGGRLVTSSFASRGCPCRSTPSASDVGATWRAR